MWSRVTRGLVLGGVFTLLAPSVWAQNEFVGALERPAEGETVNGMVRVQGWALDEEAIAFVDLYVDDEFQHRAQTEIPRIDVIHSYPDWEGVHESPPGFSTGFLASRFSNGEHTVHVVVTTQDNRSYEVGRRTIVVDNTINQAPFGDVDIPGRDYVYDAAGSFPVSGWVADTDGIDRVEVVVDGAVMQSAVYGDPRPDVGNAFPDFPAAYFSGFVAHMDSTRLLDGIHTLSVRAIDRLGFPRVIAQRTIQVFNSTNNLRPFGYLDEPQRDAVLYGTNCDIVPPCQVSPCIPLDVENKITPVRGWALDLGVREDEGRVSYAELLVDGVKWYSTDNCRFDATLGAYVNCYGLTRFDVARYYPTYPDSPRSGFLFTLDVGALMASGVPAGRHVLKVRVGDQEQTFADLPNTSGVPVWFQCAETSQDFPSFGYIDTPQNFDYVKGTIVVSGWALDENSRAFGESVQAVEIRVDGTLMGNAVLGYSRPDVRDAYPTFFNSLNSGWRFMLDTTQLSDARHRLTVTTVDRFGNRVVIGSVDFYVDNP